MQKQICYSITLCLSILGCLFLQSCTDDKPTKIYSPNGVWEQVGYGRIVEIKDSVLKVYDNCKVGCDFSFEEALKEVGEVSYVGADSLTIKNGFCEYDFIRLDEFPSICTTNTEALKKNPYYNFEVLWNTFNEQYCYFETRKIDWEPKYAEYRDKLSLESTDLELYTVMSDMLETLDDGHVTLNAPDEIIQAYRKDKKQEEEKEVPKSTKSTYELSQEVEFGLAERYLDSVHILNSGVVKWGMIDGDVAYIQTQFMLLLADYDLPKDLDFREFWGAYWEHAATVENQTQDEIDAAKAIMDNILTELKGAKAYIIDMRFNGGGKDEAALSMMGHFTDKTWKVGHKKARKGKGFTRNLDINLEPSDIRFTGDVFVLTSRRTSSAAEIFVMASLKLPNVTRIGSPTHGVFSDQLEKKLPNGWEYTMSNEIYMDSEGKDYEHIGIPADYEIEYPKDKREFYEQLLGDLKDGDAAIEKALSLIKEK